MVELVGVHGADQGGPVHDLAHVGHQLRDLHARFSVAAKGEGRAQERRVSLDEGQALALDEALGTQAPVQLLKAGLGVEHVELRRGAGHMQIDHRPRAG